MIYDNFLKLCNDIGKTPSAAALDMGLSKTTVNRWKNGGGVTDATALKIANYFGITVEELKTGIKKEPSVPKDEELDKNDAVSNLRDDFANHFPDASVHDVSVLMDAIEGGDSAASLREALALYDIVKRMSPADRKFVKDVLEAYSQYK